MINVSEYDGWVVRRNHMYLVAVAYEDTMMARWSDCIYEGHRFRERKTAENAARRTGGEMIKFNPVTGVACR